VNHFKPETGDPLRELGKSTCLQIAAALYISYNTVKALYRFKTSRMAPDLVFMRSATLPGSTR